MTLSRFVPKFTWCSRPFLTDGPPDSERPKRTAYQSIACTFIIEQLKTTNRQRSEMSELESSFNIDPRLFWDTDVTKLDPQKHSSYIIERVVSRGEWDDWKNLLDFYGHEQIRHVVISLRHLDAKTHHFLAMYFNCPLESFRCYTQKQLNHGHWNY